MAQLFSHMWEIWVWIWLTTFTLALWFPVHRKPEKVVKMEVNIIAIPLVIVKRSQKQADSIEAKMLGSHD